MISWSVGILDDLQCFLDVRDRSSEMCPYRGGTDAEHLGNLGLRPAETVDHHNGDALMLGQTSQRWDEPRIEVGKHWIRLARHEHVATVELSPRRTLPHAVQIAGGVRHRAD